MEIQASLGPQMLTEPLLWGVGRGGRRVRRRWGSRSAAARPWSVPSVPSPRTGACAGGRPSSPIARPVRLMAMHIYGTWAAFHNLVEPHDDFRRVTAFPGLVYRSEHRSERLSTSPGSPGLPEAEPSSAAGISSLPASPQHGCEPAAGPGRPVGSSLPLRPRLGVSLHIRRTLPVPPPLPTRSCPAWLGPLRTFDLPRPPSAKHCSLWKCLCPCLPLPGPAPCSLRGEGALLVS